MEYEKIYKVFISSVGMLLKQERDIIREECWKAGYFPIAMEGFIAPNNNTSIDVVVENLKKSDFVIIVKMEDVIFLILILNTCIVKVIINWCLVL